jgi:hypothetical protein
MLLLASALHAATVTNLATPAYQCTPLMSSQKRAPEEEIERVLDGDPATKWTSEVGTFPNWIELGWPQPAVLSGLIVEEDPAARTGRYRVDIFDGRVWRTVVGPQDNTAAASQPFRADLGPVRALKLRYHMLAPAQGDPATACSSIREVQVLGSADWAAALARLAPPKTVNGAAFEVVGCTATPSAVKPGETTRLELDLRLSAAVGDRYGFRITVGERVVGNPIWGADYTVARTYAWPSPETDSWVPGQTYRLGADLYVPLWAPHGRIPLMVEPVGRDRLGRLANGADGVVGAIDLRRFERDPRPWPTVAPRAEIRFEDGQPKLTVNGEVLPPYIMTEEDHPSYQGFGSAARAGFHLWRVIAFKWVNYSHETPEGLAENQKWFAELDQEVEALLRCDPEAYLIVAASARASQTWTTTYPGDAALMSNGDRLEASLSSPRWQGQVQSDHTELVQHLLAAPYAGHVIGVHYEVALETQYPGSDAGYNQATTPREEVVVGDYSPHHLAAFRQWLRKRYQGEVGALQAAWRDPAVTFESAAPAVDVLRREDLGVFRDPAKTRMPLDYWEFHSQSLADITVLIGKTIKEASGGRYICGLWGFYSNGMRGATVTPGMQHFGFGELRDVLASPYVDYLVPLRAYAMTRWGTPAVPTNLADAIRRRGKLMLVEYDDRTFYAGYRDMPQHSQQESLALARRNWSSSAIRSDGLWWMGFGGVDFGRTGGRIDVPWYAEESLVANLAEGKRLYDAIYRSPGCRSISEVAVFMNNQDVYALDVVNGRRLLASCQYQTAYFELPRLGAPVDYFLVDDLALPGMDQYKVYVFLNANYLTPEQRAEIKAKVVRAGKTVLWLYAPGFCDGHRLSTDHIADLTGFRVGYDEQALHPEAALLPGHELTANLPADLRVRAHPWEYDTTPYTLGPIFHVDDPDAEPLGAYTHNPARIAYAAKRVTGARSLYLGVPYLDSVVLRQICRVAGVHLYAQHDALVDATANYLLIGGGPQGFEAEVPLPQPSYVYDIDAGRLVSARCTAFPASVPAGHTALYYIGPDATGNPFVADDP